MTKKTIGLHTISDCYNFCCGSALALRLWVGHRLGDRDPMARLGDREDSSACVHVDQTHTDVRKCDDNESIDLWEGKGSDTWDSPVTDLCSS